MVLAYIWIIVLIMSIIIWLIERNNKIIWTKNLTLYIFLISAVPGMSLGTLMWLVSFFV